MEQGTRKVVQEEATVSMAHSFAKVVAASSTAAVAAVEKEIGPIKVPAGAVSQNLTEALAAALGQANIR
jgi:hypothetical protein